MTLKQLVLNKLFLLLKAWVYTTPEWQQARCKISAYKIKQCKTVGLGLPHTK